MPSWSKDPKENFINARSETAAAKRSFRSAFKKRRCLIPADGLYEWKATPGHKTPFHFRRRDREPFAIAGLWEKGPDGDGCALLTTSANDLLAPVHDRMPVVLSPDDYARWLDTSADPDELQALMRPADASGWESFSVGKAVGSPRSQGPSLVDPAEPSTPERSLFGC